MRLFPILLAGGCLIGASALGQSGGPAEKDYLAGLRFGYNHSRLGSTTTEGRSGAYGSGFISFKISDHWRTQTGLQVSTGGARYRRVNRVNNWQTTSISLPFAIQYFPGSHKLFTELGIQPMGLVRTKFNGDVSYVQRDQFWVSDVELLAGAGYFFNTTVGISVRYIHGIKDLSRSLNVSLEPLRNRTFQAGIILNVDTF